MIPGACYCYNKKLGTRLLILRLRRRAAGELTSHTHSTKAMKTPDGRLPLFMLYTYYSIIKCQTKLLAYRVVTRKYDRSRQIGVEQSCHGMPQNRAVAKKNNFDCKAGFDNDGRGRGRGVGEITVFRLYIPVHVSGDLNPRDAAGK